jgi:hypothetical protein
MRVLEIFVAVFSICGRSIFTSAPPAAKFGQREGGAVNLSDFSTRSPLCPSLAGRQVAALSITSAPLRFLQARQTFTLWDPTYSIPPDQFNTAPLVLYHEEGGDATQTKFPACACAVDLFAVEPWLGPFVKEVSAVGSALYQNISKYIPNGHRHASSTAYLVRKVAAIHNAVRSWADGTVVLWLDVDCLLMSPLDDMFLDFVRAYDVVTIARLPLEVKEPETGVMAFVVNSRTRQMMRRAIALYQGGMVEIAARCEQRQLHGAVCQKLSLNDVSVFRQLMGPVGMMTEWRDPQLRVGWFAVGCVEQESNTKWHFAATMYEARGRNYCKNDSLRNSSNGSAVVSPFHLFRYIAHMKGGHGVMSHPKYRRQRAAAGRRRLAARGGDGG